MAYALAQKISRDLKQIPGVVDSHIFQVPDAPALAIDVDRPLAQERGVNRGRQEYARNHEFERPNSTKFLG